MILENQINNALLFFNNNIMSYFNGGNGGFQNRGGFGGGTNNQFMQSYVDNFDFETSLSLQSFGEVSGDFKLISSNSGLRKIYDSYLDKILNPNNNQKIEIDVWFAKIGYQEKRKLLPQGFLIFLDGIWNKIKKYDENKQYDNFKTFLEVFLSYHKYFNPSAK